MLSATDAERLILTLVSPIELTEMLDLTGDVADCLGRVLAKPVRSSLDFPHWDNSAMDGYAVRAEDVLQAPVTLQIVEEIPAGHRPQKEVEAQQAARILTGAMMPAGADTVVMQEETSRNGNLVQILEVPKPEAFVRKQGSFARVGDELLVAGRLISPTEFALLAAAQQTQVAVYRQPKVAILSTGSELVKPSQSLQVGQIVDSNQYALAALVAQSGAVPVPLGIVKDTKAAVKDAIASALSQADMVLSSGGVSVGDYDYVDEVLEELGLRLHVRSVAVKPGKPLTVASDTEKVYFGLPGNPASAMVSFWRFVAPAIAKLSGRQEPWSPEFVWAKATTPLTAGGKRETYLWGQLAGGADGYEFGRAAGSHSSGNLVNLANTNGCGVVPQGKTQILVGEPVRVLKIR